MITIKTGKSIDTEIIKLKKQGFTIGFVPTMGALHNGHISLVKKAKAENDIVIVSIFVNPTQFNNREDLTKYPRKFEDDSKLLATNNCDFLFHPSINDIYPPNHIATSIDLTGIGEVMEGRFRPGHFAGVVEVVARLFELIKPDNAYFGRKDFQQVAVIKSMVRQLELPIHIAVGDIVRSETGLALSSRNLRLNEQELKDAVILSKTLKSGVEWAKSFSPKDTLKKMMEILNSSSLKLEYLNIVDPITLNDIDEWTLGATACVAAYCGKVRLIDNMELIPTYE